tara:strand:+ start:234 stop:407 length:174 start_codon:yes stop_codon:yes gene_type:complete
MKIPYKPSDSEYSQRDWDRIVGWGSVPDKYKRKDKSNENSKESNGGAKKAPLGKMTE